MVLWYYGMGLLSITNQQGRIWRQPGNRVKLLKSIADREVSSEKLYRLRTPAAAGALGVMVAGMSSTTVADFFLTMTAESGSYKK